MATVAPPAARIETLADLLDRLGGIDPRRVRFHPPPGTARVQDVIDSADHEDRLCELIAGVLVEKVCGFAESMLNGFLVWQLNAVVIPHNLGIVTGADGAIQLMPDLVRIPDAAFIHWDRLPGRRRLPAPVPQLVPNLAIEVLSPSNTRAEMTAKRRDYFTAGVERVWQVDPGTRTVAVYTTATQFVTLGVADTLDGETIVPGFRLPLTSLFAELDRQG